MIANRRGFPKPAGAILAAAPGGGKDSPGLSTILRDRLNAAVASTRGGPVSTPHLARLAPSSVPFTQATRITPFRSPTRQYPRTHGAGSRIGRRNSGITGETQAMDKRLKANGHAVRQSGKWRVSSRPMPGYPGRYEASSPQAKISGSGRTIDEAKNVVSG